MSPAGPEPTTAIALVALDGGRRPGERGLLREFEVGGVALEPADRDRVVDLAAAARRLAGVRADPAADARQRVALADEGERLAVAPLRDQRDVALRVDADRAGRAAGRPPGLGDPRDLRAEVGGRQRHGAVAREPGRGREVDGADRNAFAAGGAARRVDRLRPHPHPRRQAVAARLDRLDQGAFDHLDARVVAQRSQQRDFVVERGAERAAGLRAQRPLRAERDRQPGVGQLQREAHAAGVGPRDQHAVTRAVGSRVDASHVVSGLLIGVECRARAAAVRRG